MIYALPTNEKLWQQYAQVRADGLQNDRGLADATEYERRPGERVGGNWRVPAVAIDRPVRHMVYNTNFWKSFVQARLPVAMGDKGCLSLFGDNPEAHRLFADHLTADYSEQNSECAVGASIQGASLIGEGGPEKKMVTVRLSDLQKAATLRKPLNRL